SQKWSPSLIYASGFGTGIVWLVLALTGFIKKIVKLTPKCVIRGIQLALGILLAIEGLKMISGGLLLGIISILIVLIFRENKYASAAIVLMVLGLGIMGFQGKLLKVIHLEISLPPITIFTFREIWKGLILAGFAQIFLTLTNAVIATAALIREYWPDKAVSEKRLALNMGIMNTVVPFFGGMPMCHGAGGLAGQYYFGARTGGTNIMEGLIEVSLGLFLSKSIQSLFSVFPMSIIGAMMILVGIELAKFIKDIRGKVEILVLIITTSLSIVTNIAIGFISGIALYQIFKRFKTIKIN
ncbi:MAG: putative sulfate/molybdate transporter, partial [Candidatus Aminicenantia bacterium]